MSFPETRISLILRLAEWPDVQAWQEFADIYAPAIYGLAIRKGLQPADAEDVTQDILFGVARAIERFKPDAEKARFRTWLHRITQNLIAEFCRRRARIPNTSCSDSWLRLVSEQASATHKVDDDFQREYRQAIFQLAARYVRSRVSAATWEAFHRTTVAFQSPQLTGEQLKMSVGNVYVARSRVLKMLKEESERLLQQYDHGLIAKEDVPALGINEPATQARQLPTHNSSSPPSSNFERSDLPGTSYLKSDKGRS